MLKVCEDSCQEYSGRYALPTDVYKFEEEEILGNIDTVSKKLFPKDSFKRLTPLKCTGDGNCLFRAVSNILQGNENLHNELRIRVAVELAMNIDKYCDNAELKKMNSTAETDDPLSVLIHTCIDKNTAMKMPQKSV